MNRFLAILLVAIMPFVAFAAEPEGGGKESSKVNAQVDLRTIPFTVPDDVIGSVEKFASECDVLTLGETHGTQEVPLIALALMTPLSKLGYGALALEVPRDQQASLMKWATGKTEKVPKFFSKPSTDGRGNAQLLSLIRIAVSPPFGWKIICFDEMSVDLQREIEQGFVVPEEKKGPHVEAPEFTEEYGILYWKRRDAEMATNLAKQLKKMKPQPKVLAICGNMHNRIENNEKIPELEKLWPSFASVLQRDNPDWKLGSINIEFQSGGFYNGGKVQQFHGPKIEKAEAQPATGSGYHWALKFPKATAATFLATPKDSE